MTESLNIFSQRQKCKEKEMSEFMGSIGELLIYGALPFVGLDFGFFNPLIKLGNALYFELFKHFE